MYKQKEVNTLNKNLRRKNYVLDMNKLKRAQKVMGTRTETETIHRALEIATSEIDLAEALQDLLTHGKGRVSDVFKDR